MIVRTYGRRNRGGIGRTFSGSTMDVDVCKDPFRDPFAFSEEDCGLHDQQSPQEDYNFTFSSQDSTRWTFESETCPLSGGLGRGVSQKEAPLQLLAPIKRTGGITAKKSKKVKKGKRGTERVLSPMVSLPPLLKGTTTLMETQEYGEMMEHIDEVNFSLDGLQKGRPVRVKRGSLLSLLTICGVPQHRTLLRAYGLSKKIIDTIMSLSLDDPLINLAAAALLYVLTIDGHDNHLLDSDSSINFLMKLLKPSSSGVIVDKAPSFSHRLLSLQRISCNSVDSTATLDPSDNKISDKVKEILVNNKDIETGDEGTDALPRPELSANWIALLTIEKACSSTVSLAEGTVSKTVGNFKETLRELGGLDAVFDLEIDLLATLKDWLKLKSSSIENLSREENLRCLVLLLRCLKIMENATIFSEENQSHLLDMRQCLAKQKSSLSFTKLMINFINVLSDLSLLRKNSSTVSSPEMPINISSDSEHLSERKVESSTISSLRSSQECSSSGRIFSDSGSGSGSITKSSNSSGLLSSSCSDSLILSVEGVTKSIEDDVIITQLGTSKAISCRTVSQRESSVHDVKMKSSLGKRYVEETGHDDCQDPFAFDEEECVPTKWDLLHGKKKVARKRKNKVAHRDLKEACSAPLTAGLNELEDSESRQSSQTFCSSVSDEESTCLLAGCLLTAVKVLMNLTNDNELGCHQIASCGGLETLSSLIAAHFPMFGSSNSFIDLGSQTEAAPFSDHELDLLVAILGLLVNLVEKDDDNRSRLASASVSIPSSTGLNRKRQNSIIPSLCSIFLANQGAGEAVGEGTNEPWNEEVALLQGEKEAEKMIIEAYAALLLAFLSTDSKFTREAISSYLPKHNLKVLVPVLERFVAFHVALDMISSDTHQIVNKVIESCKAS